MNSRSPCNQIAVAKVRPGSQLKHETLTSSPFVGDGQVIYLCGNSLGLLPKRARTLLIEEIDVWSKRYALPLAIGGYQTDSKT